MVMIWENILLFKSTPSSEGDLCKSVRNIVHIGFKSTPSSEGDLQNPMLTIPLTIFKSTPSSEGDPMEALQDYITKSDLNPHPHARVTGITLCLVCCSQDLNPHPQARVTLCQSTPLVSVAKFKSTPSSEGDRTAIDRP